MRSLRLLLLWPAIALSTVLFGLPAIAAAFVPPRGDWFLRFARGWARTILFMAGISVRVLHPEKLRREGGFVIVANHESLCDILVLLAVLPMQVRFLAKRSIFRVPVLGWSIAAAGFIPVDRGEPARTTAAVEAALRRLEHGRSVVVFPEETRSATGELLPFKKGAALLALRSRLPILPVGLGGTSHILPRGSLRMERGAVAVAVGDPIAAEAQTPRERATLTRIVREAVERLRQEARSALP